MRMGFFGEERDLLPGGGGRGLPCEKVSLRGINQGFLSHLGCS